MLNNYIKLEYYINESLKGNSDAAYMAAKLLATGGTSNDYVIQKHFNIAANQGNEKAQRILGIYGLCNRLVTDDSAYDNIVYNPDKHDGIVWLKEAACSGDVISTYLLGGCYQHGLGVNKDSEKADLYFNQIISVISPEAILETMLIIEFLLLDTKKLVDKCISVLVNFDDSMAA